MEQGPESSERRLPGWALPLMLFVVGAVVALAVVLLLRGCEPGGKDKQANLQTVRFEEPTDAGKDPFTGPADVKGPEKVGGAETPAVPGAPASGDSAIGSGPFGGSGSDLVCDRELLIKSLLAQPDRMRAWAGVLRIDPTPGAVSAYIRSLTPVTLTVDTRVTNHTFVNGRAVPLQSILAAGTAVLVDKYGRPVARCRCGNPLLEPIFYPKPQCTNCPPKYRPPLPCRYRRYRPWYPYPPRYLPPRVRDPYPRDYGKPRYGTKPNGRICYLLYSKAPRVDYPPRYQPPAPDPTSIEPTYTEPETSITDTYTGPVPEPEPAPEPKYSEPKPAPEPEHTEPRVEEPYCYEADSPDRFEPGCQGTYGPPP